MLYVGQDKYKGVKFKEHLRNIKACEEKSPFTKLCNFFLGLIHSVKTILNY